MKILPLDAWTITKIKAGQIINNYYDIIKELIENSIDAKSTNITIYFNIINNEIKIIDNGIGMTQENLKSSILLHHTSKFTSLNNIKYLGFRGEGLYVIENICTLTIISKPINSLAYKLYKKDNQFITEITSSNDGTTIILNNIFHNLPGKNKFINTKKDFINIVLYLQKISIIYPHIKISLYKNNKHYLYLYGENYKDLIYQIFKIENYEEFYILQNNIKIKILINRDLKVYKNKNNILFFVNNRYVEDFGLLKIIQEILKNKFGSSYINFMLCFLYLPEENVDCNINPHKTQIQINNLEEIKSIIDNFFINKYCKNTYNKLHENTIPLLSNNINKWFYFKKKFIICEYDNEIYFLDIHALSERLLLENIKNYTYNTQILLEEITLNLTEEEKILFMDKEIEFQKLKFKYKLISHYLLIYEIPDFINISEMNNIFKHFIKNNHHIFLHKLAEFSCKNSLKSGYNINEQEIVYFLKLINENQNLNTCCHGRNTFKKFSINDFNKIFNR